LNNLEIEGARPMTLTSPAQADAAKTAPAPLQVPPAKVFFPEEDRKEILRQIDAALSSGQLTLGSIGKELEERFAERHGARYAVAVNSGTCAIEIPLRCFGVAGKEVLVPANTFFATAAAVLAAGAYPRFVDCDLATMAVDPAAVEEAIGPETAGLVVVHIAGAITPHIGELKRICDERGLFLLEDAAHAHGSSLGGQSAGTFGRAGAFSFYPTKVMAGGEGGMIITDDEDLANEALIYRDQGKAGFLTNTHTHLGYNWRMSEPHAAIALSQLGRLDEFIAHRQHVAQRYDELLVDVPVTPLAIPEGSSCNFYKYVAYLPEGVDRAELKKRLRQTHGVGLSGEVYELPLHHQPVFEPWAGDMSLPVSDEICARHICLPVSAVMTDDQVDLVVSALATELARG
jgi:dTDP-4-amino-4,6-dideoxygalactose transaminase